MSTPQLLDVAGRRRSPATLPGSRAGRPPRNKGFRYVVGKLQKAGYAVTVQPFTFPFFKELAPPIFERTAPTARTYVEGTDFQSMEYSGSGDVTGGVVATNDIVIPPDATAGSSNSGCEASDFTPASATQDQVALIQRGTCDFVVKARNAEAAGYDAAIIFNEGQAGRTDIISGTLGGPVGIPVLDATFAVGEERYNLEQAGTPATVHIVSNTVSETRTTASAGPAANFGKRSTRGAERVYLRHNAPP